MLGIYIIVFIRLLDCWDFFGIHVVSRPRTVAGLGAGSVGCKLIRHPQHAELYC